ncbi:hypothetical protein MTBBW1_2790004 [Desulfamplus magnetovallimortis]|uniref:Uncharacterized protein n=1 Tax=Desulfamplus magnetovallimortis TaxID=1246637 RepID=A0A1W1HFK1_9BACT|nr:hypothetical protein MTBBW1_2790004 [Desulfamplus magnetovallimortis]
MLEPLVSIPSNRGSVSDSLRITSSSGTPGKSQSPLIGAVFLTQCMAAIIQSGVTKVSIPSNRGSVSDLYAFFYFGFGFLSQSPLIGAVFLTKQDKNGNPFKLLSLNPL